MHRLCLCLLALVVQACEWSLASALAQSGVSFPAQPELQDDLRLQAAPRFTVPQPQPQSQPGSLFAAQPSFDSQNAQFLDNQKPLARGSIKLSRPGQHNDLSAGSSPKKQTTNSVWTTIGSLCLVLLLILVASRLLKKHAPANIGGVPVEAIELLGKRRLDQRQIIHLIRCGSRILVVGSSQSGLNTLCEVTDPVEVDYLAGLCKSSQSSAGVVEGFRQLFHKRQQGSTSRTEEISETAARQAERSFADVDNEFSTASLESEPYLEAVHE